MLATQADSVLMVTRADKTRRASVKCASALLAQFQANQLGVVYNGVAGRKHVHESGYGYYRHWNTQLSSVPSKSG